jgi:hypothetical protein
LKIIVSPLFTFAMVDFQNTTVVALAAPQGLEDGFPEHSIFGRDWAQKESRVAAQFFFRVYR